MCACKITSVVSSSLQPYGLWPTRPLCPWGLSRQEYWSGFPCLPPGILPHLGIESTPLISPELAGGFFTTSVTWEAWLWACLDNLVGEGSACSAGDSGEVGLIPGSGRFPWRRKWKPTPVFLPEKSRGQRNLVNYNPGDCKESDTTVCVHTHTHTYTHTHTHTHTRAIRREKWEGRQKHQEVSTLVFSFSEEFKPPREMRVFFCPCSSSSQLHRRLVKIKISCSALKTYKTLNTPG